ncbi:MAG: M23 family metallopeptidase [Dehalococcoidia bacterium]|nr:M23 family metallopeptidase [Dehalococcoidia bacterium]
MAEHADDPEQQRVPPRRWLVAPVVALALLISGCGAEAREAVDLKPVTPPVPTVVPAVETAPAIPRIGATASPTATSTSSPIVDPTAPVTSPTPEAAGAAAYAFPVSPIPSASFDTQVNGHPYPATDVFAAAGTAIVAVTSGTVGFVNRVDRWSERPNDGATRGGLYLAVRGADGLQYYYSHLADIRPDLEAGTWVEPGDLLGHVGTSGNARFTPPHLHFGISCPTEPDDWERRVGEFNPIPYLVAWSAGDATRSPAEAYGAACAGGARPDVR